MKLKFALTLLTFYAVAMSFNVARAQAQTLVCGDIAEGEIIAGKSQTARGPFGGDITFDDYILDIRAGTIVNLTVKPAGGTLNVGMVLVDSGANDVVIVNDAGIGDEEKLINFPIGSSNQILRIIGVNPPHIGSTDRLEFYGSVHTTSGRAGHYFGAYEIQIGCIRDDTVIEPGEIIQTTAAPSSSTFSGVGFPGLASVDFATAIKLPLIIATPMAGAITPTGGEILGFTLDNVNANDKLDLSITRLSGNLNLGVVILSAENKVVFYGGLITSESLSTRLTLPTAGQYTIGVFRVDLLPPDAPEATAFQMTGTLNP